MGFFNILKLSLHNLKNNKLRTLLTVIVLTVVSIVIIFLSGIAYSFYRSVNENVNYIFNQEKTEINISAVYEEANEYYHNINIKLDDVDNIIKILEKENYISYISFFQPDNFYGTNTMNLSIYDSYIDISIMPFYAKSNPFIGKENYLERGRMWNSSDENTNNIWLTAKYIGEYELGDTISLCDQNYSYNNDSILVKSDYKVAGFLNVSESSNSSGYGFIDYHNYNFAVSSLNEYTSYSNKGVIKNIYATMIPQKDYYYGIKAQNYFKNTVDEIEDYNLTFGNIQVYCDLVENLNLLAILFYVMIGIVGFISIIIILLTIGSVANTIKISAEQNRKFFGVMKAIGMKNKSLRHILTGQIVLMTLIGVIIATITVHFSLIIIKGILTSLLKSMFYQIEPIVICQISIFIPIAIAVILIGFVLLFTKTSLKNFSKMDVISVINEVN